MRTTSIALSYNETICLGSQSSEFRHMFGLPSPRPLHSLLRRLDPIFQQHRSGFFLRTGACSWKGSQAPNASMQPLFNGTDALSVMQLNHPRVSRYLKTCLHRKETPWLHIRKWTPKAKGCEYRCVMRENQFMGGVFNSLTGPVVTKDNKIIDQTGTQHALDFFQLFKGACHLNNVVFDISISNGEVLLLEINPYLERTVLPGFNWSNLSQLDKKLWHAGSLRTAALSAWRPGY